jgi:nickel-dependent lactate racemase
MNILRYAQTDEGLSENEIRQAVESSLNGRKLHRVLLIPPDYTRFFSGAGTVTNDYYHAVLAAGGDADILPAVGTHVPMTRQEASSMYGDIPFVKFIAHQWKTDAVKLGEVPGDYISEITEGLWTEPVSVEINQRLLDEKYDLIISIGQVVPHEVVGMANYTKNLFVGCGGADMINASHMIGAVYGMERMMGKDRTPVRRIFDYGLEHYLQKRPILFALTVTTAPEEKIHMHGLFIGEGRDTFETAVALSQKKNINFVEHGIKKCVVYMTPKEFKSTWVGNKSIYRTRMAMADGGELIVLAPGIERFGEDEERDRIIRKYGFRGRLHTLAMLKDPENKDLQENLGLAAHLIHSSPEGRFSVTYAVKNIAKEEIEAVGFQAADYDEMSRKYNPEKLQYGYNTMPDGEEIFFIPNPAIGLWVSREKFGEE